MDVIRYLGTTEVDFLAYLGKFSWVRCKKCTVRVLSCMINVRPF